MVVSRPGLPPAGDVWVVRAQGSCELVSAAQGHAAVEQDKAGHQLGVLSS